MFSHLPASTAGSHMNQVAFRCVLTSLPAFLAIVEPTRQSEGCCPARQLHYLTPEERAEAYKGYREARTKTMTRVRKVIKEHFGKDYTLHPFGSTCYGAGRPRSDLDLCIFVSTLHAFKHVK